MYFIATLYVLKLVKTRFDKCYLLYVIKLIFDLDKIKCFSIEIVTYLLICHFFLLF